MLHDYLTMSDRSNAGFSQINNRWVQRLVAAPAIQSAATFRSTVSQPVIAMRHTSKTRGQRCLRQDCLCGIGSPLRCVKLITTFLRVSLELSFRVQLSPLVLSVHVLPRTSSAALATTAIFMSSSETFMFFRNINHMLMVRPPLSKIGSLGRWSLVESACRSLGDEIPIKKQRIKSRCVECPDRIEW